MSTAVNAVEMARSAEEIRERVRAAGVVGAGGAGFPAHVKLQAQVRSFWLTPPSANRCSRSTSS